MPKKRATALIRQVTGAVQWEGSMRTLIAKGATQFVEAGPGSVLTGLLRQIDHSQTCLNVENEATLQKAKAHFASNLALRRMQRQNAGSKVLLFHHLVGRETQRLVLELHPHRAKLLAPVDPHSDDYSAGAGPRFLRADDLVALDRSPLPARAPVQVKLVEGVALVGIRMLFPVGIIHPDSVGRLEVLGLHCDEKTDPRGALPASSG